MPKTATIERRKANAAVLEPVASLLDALDRPLIVSDRRGRLLFKNLHAHEFVRGLTSTDEEVNLFKDILTGDATVTLRKLTEGQQEVIPPFNLSASNACVGCPNSIGWPSISNRLLPTCNRKRRTCGRPCKS